MPNIIEITDISAPELDVYARLTQAQLATISDCYRQNVLLCGTRYSRGKRSHKWRWHGLLMTYRQNYSDIPTQAEQIQREKYILRRNRLPCMSIFCRHSK